MKKVSMFLLGLTAIAALAMSVWGCGTAAAADGTPGSVYVVGQNTGISVSGIGKITVTPDTAVINMGVQVEGLTVTVAQQAAAAAMDKVMVALKADGIADTDIKTTGYSVYPVYNYDSGKTPAITGYSVSNTITVKVRSVGDAGSVLDDVATAAGNDIRINNISFTIDNPEQYNEEARALAMADALQRAQQLADLGGVELGKPAYITESGGYTPQPPIYYDSRAGAAVPEIVTPISPGETELQLSVQVVYNIQ
jgi:uncharacterized protein YggE